MMAAAAAGGYKHVQCVSHTLQLAIQDALSVPTIENVFVVARQLAVFIHISPLATTALEDHQRNLGKPIQHVVILVATQWNSTFFLPDRLLTLRSDIFAILHDTVSSTCIGRKNLKVLTDSQWTIMEQLTVVSRPLVTATEVLCSEEYPTSSSISHSSWV